MEAVKKSNIELKLGDIIEIGSPTNSLYHQNSYFIEYIDEFNIDLINISSLDKTTLSINESNSAFTDESITSVYLLKRNEDSGFAKQNNLNVHTWINIEIGGEYPKKYTGEITNIIEDMIEVTTYPERLVLNIDFEYKGIPRNLPIESIEIREKPKDIIDEHTDIVDADPNCQISSPAKKEIIEDDIPDVTVTDSLKEMYNKIKPIIHFGDDVDDILFTVEIPDHEKQYNIDVQTNDLLDELLSSTANDNLGYEIEQRIHNLIDRFKQLRQTMSVFDNKMNIKSHKYKGIIHKPLVDTLVKLEKHLHWIIPIVSHKRKLYTDNEDSVYGDRIEVKILEDLNSWTECVEKYKSSNTIDRYATYIKDLDNFMLPFQCDPIDNKSFIGQLNKINMNVDTIVDNHGNFMSAVESGKRKFVVQRYIAPNDEVTLKSILMLPQQFIKYSHVSLPNTSILRKSELSNYCIYPYRLFNEKTQISPHVVSDLNLEIDYSKNNLDYLDKIVDYSIDEKFMEDKERFIKLLKVIVPSTSTIIDDYLGQNDLSQMSFSTIVKVLEPYMIYSDDICYHKTQFDKIREIINKRIDKYISKYETKRRRFQKLRKNLVYDFKDVNKIEKFFLTKPDLLESLQFGYNIEKDELQKTFTSECLNLFYESDGATLLADLITFMNVDLHSSEIDLLKQMEPPKLDNMGTVKSKDCSRKYLTKRYTSMKELQDDQDTNEVFYDKDLDDTPYELLKQYEKVKETMSKDKFEEYLKENLISIHGVQAGEPVNELIETLLDGQKRVKENEYAVLSIKPILENGNQDTLSEKEKKQIEIEGQIREKVGYYRRVKSQWVFEPNIDPEVFIDSNTLFCNIQPNCFKNEINQQCEPSDFTKQRLDALSKARMIKEFDNRITTELENLSAKYEKQLQKDLKFNKVITRMKHNQRYKFNNFAFEYGKTLKENEIILSPYLELRDIILGENDFVKRQLYIMKFKESVCRESLENENENYYYCKNTDTTLLPAFYYELATAYLVNNNYESSVALVCSRIGTKSDDGDSIVDKHSGHVIVKTAFLHETQYTEDGFEIHSHEVLDTQEIEEKLENIASVLSKNDILYESKQNGMVFNVMSTICGNIGIQVDAIKEFVFIHANRMIDKIPSQQEYELKSKKNDTKKQIPYDIYRHRLCIWIISSCVFIKIQTQIPSIKVRKTFPGCNKSFKGYPLSSDDDLSGINYMACVLKKVAVDIVPWNSIHRLKIDVYNTSIKSMIDKLVKTDDVRNLYVTKREDLGSKSETIPDEIQIQKWTSFLPPLISYKIRTLQNVTKEFEKEFFEQMKTGNSKQHKSLNILNSKCELHGYGIIEIINGIVKKSNPLLSTESRIPFVENACCNNDDTLRTIDYFIAKDDNIRKYINIARETKEFINEAKRFAKPQILFHSEFTGISYPPIVSTLSDENLYQCFIHYCNLHNNKPIPLEFRHLIQQKLDGFPIDKNILEKIEFMKRHNKSLTKGHFESLMKVLRQQNTIVVEENIIYNEIESLRSILDLSLIHI